VRRRLSGDSRALVQSTLIALVGRLYDTNSGSVRVAGVDVREHDLVSLRRRVALVSQEPTLFTGTVAENIRFGRDSAPLERVRAAATLANAHEFIAALPNGYDEQLGEGGASLSGGQKQRYACWGRVACVRV